jgi:hypothetical protein
MLGTKVLFLLSVTGSNGIPNFTDAIFDAQGNFFFYGFSV